MVDVHGEKKLLRELYDEFLKLPFPSLGYAVEGFPEWNSVLCGYVTRVFSDEDNLTLEEALVIPNEIFLVAEKVIKGNTENFASMSLITYLGKLREIESQMLKCLRIRGHNT